MLRFFAYVSLAAIAGSLFVPGFSQASVSGPSVVINEIGAYESSGHEWIEILNVSHETVDLEGWTFSENDTDHTLSLHQGSSFELLPDEYAIIAQNAETFVADYPAFTGLVMDSAWSSLRESGEEIGLNDADGNVIESFAYIPAPDHSLERIDPLLADYTDANWSEHADDNSVGAANSNYLSAGGSAEEDDDDSDNEEEEEEGNDDYDDDSDGNENENSFAPSDAVINELQADPPENQREWIELFNNTDESIDLLHWELHDGSGKLANLDGSLPSGQFMVFELSTAKLNNAGDLVMLLDPDDTIIDQVAYGDWDDEDVTDNAPQASSPNSVARSMDGVDNDDDYDDYQVTSAVTRGTTNRIEEPLDHDDDPLPPEVTAGEGEDSACECSCESSSAGETETTDSTQSSYDLSANIIINEIFPNPEGSDNETEFIELKNAGSTGADIAGWKLADATARKYEIASTVIPAGSYVTIYRSESGIALNNTSDEVRLYRPDDSLADSMAYEGSNEAESYALDGTSWRWTDTPTPSQANAFPAQSTQDDVNDPRPTDYGLPPTNAPAEETDDNPPENETGGQDFDIIISEILPNPEGSDDAEWIEIYNAGDTDAVLDGWSVDDAEGGSKPFVLDGLAIDAGSYLVLEREDTGIALNNTSDAARLIDPSGDIVDEATYDDTEEAASYALDGKKFAWTSELTPGSANKIVWSDEKSVSMAASTKKAKETKAKKATAPISGTLNEVRKLPDGTKVRVTAQVAVPPGVFGKQYFYISGSGIQVYMHKSEFPSMKIGDRVQITGKLAESGGEKRIKVSAKEDIEVLETDLEPPAPHEVQAADIGEAYEGQLVTMEAEITEIKGSNMWLDDGESEALAYLKKGAGIDKKKFEEGDRARITGIVSQSKKTYKLLPRNQDDIQVIEEEPEFIDAEVEIMEIPPATRKSDTLTYILIALSACTLALAGILIRDKWLASRKKGKKPMLPPGPRP